MGVITTEQTQYRKGIPIRARNKVCYVKRHEKIKENKENKPARLRKCSIITAAKKKKLGWGGVGVGEWGRL